MTGCYLQLEELLAFQHTLPLVRAQAIHSFFSACRSRLSSHSTCHSTPTLRRAHHIESALTYLRPTTTIAISLPLQGLYFRKGK